MLVDDKVVCIARYQLGNRIHSYITHYLVVGKNGIEHSLSLYDSVPFQPASKYSTFLPLLYPSSACDFADQVPLRLNFLWVIIN